MKYPSFCLNKKTKEILPCGKEKTIKTWLKGAGGMLRAKVWLPAVKAGEKCPMVIIMHGIMTTKDIYPQPELHILPDEGHLLNGNKEEVCSIVTGFLEKHLK